ncbi:MAG: galactose oxidase [Bacteroidota bacterium]|nr:galactose oxidase [Bacteroidota bacterium]
MKRFKDSLFLLGSAALIMASCAKSSTSTSLVGNWIKRSELDGVARTEAVAFTIGNLAYISTGYDGTNRLVDTWAYDATSNSWSQKADFAGTGRNSAVAFSIGDSVAYVTTGYDGYNNLKDTWKYSAATNSWVSKAAFAGTGRYDAIAFSISNYGYVASGFDGNYTKDFWQYNPASDTWTQKPSWGGSKRSQAVAFVYNNKAYVCTGVNNGQTVNDFWSFDPSVTSGSPWTQLRDIANTSSDTYDDDYTDIVRMNAIAFVMGNKAYITTGENGGYISKTWEYDFASDLWARKTDYERSARSGAVAFSVQGRGFVGSGKNSTYVYDDFDEFKPNDPYNAND